MLAASSFRQERPLLVFDRTKGLEDFARFGGTFEFYSRGVGRDGRYMVETSLEGAPFLRNQQFQVDRPDVTFAGLKGVLKANVGWTFHACRAEHKLQTVHGGEVNPLFSWQREYMIFSGHIHHW